jgi:dTDP-glucose pyrophosphorylase
MKAQILAGGPGTRINEETHFLRQWKRLDWLHLHPSC